MIKNERRYLDESSRNIKRIDIENNTLEMQKHQKFIRLICDHISGMTDQYAAREYKKIYEPEFF